jgi:hypothetical protein
MIYCAKEIQETCQTKSDLKLRNGIHQGEVVFEGDTDNLIGFFFTDVIKID